MKAKIIAAIESMIDGISELLKWACEHEPRPNPLIAECVALISILSIIRAHLVEHEGLSPEALDRLGELLDKQDKPPITVVIGDAREGEEEG